MDRYFIFFVASGYCSLVYEVVWLRAAMAGFGVNAPVVSMVLSVFMGGLGLGSWLAGRLEPQVEDCSGRTALRLYGLAELGIGLWGLAVPFFLARGRRLLAVTAADWGSGSYYLASGGFIAAALLPGCVLMGVTYPLAMSAIRRQAPQDAGRSFSYLYLANVIGAALGTVLPAFILIELQGFHRTLQMTALINSAIAAGAWFLSRKPRPASAAPRAAVSRVPAGGEPRENAVLLTMGVAGMGMQVVWIRQFTPFVSTAVYAFASVLFIYLLSTALGSRLYRKQVESGRPARDAWAWAFLGLAGLLPILAADPDFGPSLAGLRERYRLPLQILRVSAGISPLCALFGYLTPMLIDRCSRGDPAKAGSAYAINVLGSLLGPLLAGFVLLPRLGEKLSLAVLVLPLFAAGFRAEGTGPRRVLAASLGCLALMLCLTAGQGSLHSGDLLRRDYEATVIATGQGRTKRLLVNGVGMTYLTPITKMMSHLPLAFLPEAPRDGLVVAFGMGTTFRSLLSWGARATAAELIPSVPEVFGYFHPDASRLMRLPGARVVIDDGRRFLERTAQSYDLITVDPPPPFFAAGSSLLYSIEFFAAARNRLRPAGILQQWVPVEDDPYAVAAVARALIETFPHVRAFRSVEGWGYHFLAGSTSLARLTALELARRLPREAAADLVEWGPFARPEMQFQAVLDGEVALEKILNAAPGAPALSDDRPVNEYFVLRRLWPAFWLGQ